MSSVNEADKRDPSETKPVIHKAYIKDVVARLYGINVTGWNELNSYDDKNYHILVDNQHTNQFVLTVSDNGYLLKILNSGDSKNSAIVEGQHKLLVHLHENMIPVQMPVMNVKGTTWSLEQVTDPDNTQITYGPYVIQMLTYVEGEILLKRPFFPTILYKVGKFAGRIHNAFQGFEDDYIKNKSKGFIWSLTHLQGLSEYTVAVKDQDNLKLVHDVMAAFVKDVIPIYDRLPEGYIHGDINDQNIIVNEGGDGTYDVTAFIDFMHVQNSYTVFDVAIMIAYLSIESVDTDQIDVGGYVLAGYLTERPLSYLEMNVLKVCICGRLIQTLVLGAYSYYKNPKNEYVLQTSKRGWSVLEKIWNVSNDDLLSRWNTIIESQK